MKHIDFLIETTEILQAAIQTKDREKGFEAVTILLMQFIEIYGFEEGMFTTIFPYLESLKGRIEAGDFDDADKGVSTLLLQLRSVGEASDAKRKH